MGDAATGEGMLWRDYDPGKTAQDFIQDPEEKNKPLWRVVTLNRN